MRIATLQFSPALGQIEANINQADSLLNTAESRGQLSGLDILVLPELAFTGYNFASLVDITPFLEPTAAGVSTHWAIRIAQRLNCVVAVGYPEISKSSSTSPISDSTTPGETSTIVTSNPYNSLVFVSSQGEIIAHHRKAFLYYTDNNWAKEGPNGFYHGDLPLGGEEASIKVAAGICMDINPYKFEAPYTAYEFANHCRETKAKVVIISMAWLTRLSHTETYGLEGDVSEKIRRLPDMDTISYWIRRFSPLLGINGNEEEVIVVFANRAGEEGEDPLIGEVRYAGSSSVMGMTKASRPGETNVRIWNMMGRGVDGLLLVDTTHLPLYSVRNASPDQSEYETAGEESDSL